MLSDKTLNVLTAIVNNEIREKAYIRSVQTGVVENDILQQMDLEIAELHKICYELINYKSSLQQRDLIIAKQTANLTLDYYQSEVTVHALKSSKVAN